MVTYAIVAVVAGAVGLLAGLGLAQCCPALVRPGPEEPEQLSAETLRAIAAEWADRDAHVGAATGGSCSARTPARSQ